MSFSWRSSKGFLIFGNKNRHSWENGILLVRRIFWRKKNLKKSWKFCSWLNKTSSEFGKCFLQGNQNWSQFVQKITCGYENFFLKQFGNHLLILRDIFLISCEKKLSEHTNLLSPGPEERFEENCLFSNVFIHRYFPTVFKRFPEFWRKKPTGWRKRISFCPEDLFKDFHFWKKSALYYYWI